MLKASSTLAREAGTSRPPLRTARRSVSASHLLIAAVVVTAFVLNFLVLQQRDAVTYVAVADVPISAGSSLSVESVRMVPVSAEFEGLPSLIEESTLPAFAGWIVDRAMSEGELIEASSLAEPSAASGLRTMSLPVPVEHAAGGSIISGDRVDVIAVVDGAASYVVADVEVVAVSETVSGLGGAGEHHLVLAVSSDQALALAAALEAGPIDVVRSTGAPGVNVGVEVDSS